MTRRGRFVVGAATGDPAQFDALDRNRRDEVAELLGSDSGGGGPVAQCDRLDGNRDDRAQLFVGAALPLQLPGVDDQDVDVAAADGLLAGDERGVGADACFGTDGIALALDHALQPARNRAGETDVLRVAAPEDRRQDDDRGHDEDHHDQRCPEGARAAALTHLAPGDEPSLTYAAHIATA